MRSYVHIDCTINLVIIINNFKWSTGRFDIIFHSLLTREVARLFCETWIRAMRFSKCFADLVLLFGKERDDKTFGKLWVKLYEIYFFIAKLFFVHCKSVDLTTGLFGKDHLSKLVSPGRALGNAGPQDSRGPLWLSQTTTWHRSERWKSRQTPLFMQQDDRWLSTNLQAAIAHKNTKC